MKNGTIFLLLLTTMGALPVVASVTLRTHPQKRQVTLSQTKSQRWQTGDSFCLFKKEKKIACGTIQKANTKTALGNIEKTYSGKLSRGLAAQPEAQLESRVPASTNVISETSPLPKASLDYSLTLGMSVGFHHFIPAIHFQKTITPHLAIGMKPSLMNSSSGADSLNAFGTYFTLNYYGKKPYHGLWIQGGGGYYSFTARSSSSEQRDTSVSFLAMLGWKDDWVFGMNIGAAVGFEYISTPSKISLVEVRFSRLQVAACLEVGMVF